MLRRQSTALGIMGISLLLSSLSLAAPVSDASRGLSARQLARIRTVPADRRVQQVVRESRLPSFARHNKTFVALPATANRTDYLQRLSPNMVEFFISPGFHHLYTRIGDTTFSRITGLSQGRWYPGSSERIGVLVSLSNTEMSALKGYLEGAVAHPRRVLGPFNYGGGVPPNRSNCTSYITNARVGENNECLADLLGVNRSGYPQGFIRSLMRSRSDKVKAVVVHNPSGNFGENYHFNLN